MNDAATQRDTALAVIEELRADLKEHELWEGRSLSGHLDLVDKIEATHRECLGKVVIARDRLLGVVCNAQTLDEARTIALGGLNLTGPERS